MRTYYASDKKKREEVKRKRNEEKRLRRQNKNAPPRNAESGGTEVKPEGAEDAAKPDSPNR